MDFRNPDPLEEVAVEEGEVLLARNRTIREWVAELASLSAWEAVHADRVAVYAVATGHTLGLDDADLFTLRYAATLHDIGKLAWPRHVFEGERPTPSILAAHVIKGEERLREVAFLREAAPIVRSHHERWDGSGYPDGLLGEEIPLLARIVGTCEAFEVLAHGSPWQPAISDPFGELSANLLDRNVVEALRKVHPLIHPFGT